MRLEGVVVVGPAVQLVDHGSSVGLFGDADVVSLHGAHERLGHAVGLRAFDGCCAGLEIDLACEAAGLLCCVTAAIVSQPFDGGRQPVHTADDELFLGLWRSGAALGSRAPVP